MQLGDAGVQLGGRPGTYGVRPNMPEATTKLSHRNDDSPVATRYLPSSPVTRVTRMPVRTGSSKVEA